MTVNLVYMTAGSMDEARRIGAALVESRLAACVNILEQMSSLYMWQDRLQEDSEVVVIAKTTEDKVPELVAKVRSLHSYELPCIVCLPVSGGHRPFLDWIAGEVAAGGA
jgi:periplasmic divalent cation tolerance protein